MKVTPLNKTAAKVVSTNENASRNNAIKNLVSLNSDEKQKCFI